MIFKMVQQQEKITYFKNIASSGKHWKLIRNRKGENPLESFKLVVANVKYACCRMSCYLNLVERWKEGEAEGGEGRVRNSSPLLVVLSFYGSNKLKLQWWSLLLLLLFYLLPTLNHFTFGLLALIVAPVLRAILRDYDKKKNKKRLYMFI